MYALSYTSTAVHMPTTPELEALFIEARRFSELVSVTGALLVWDQSFFEYVEGPREAIDEVHERILKSRLHREITQFFYEPIDARCFDQWHMGIADAPRSGMLAAANDRWESAARAWQARTADQPAGVTILLQFWRNARRLG